MDDKINVAVTGYYATGSSAVIDLLKEYKNIKIASPVDGDYEHVAFYSNGGFFDLASILLSDYCCPYMSDMAINNFISSTKRLNENDFGWFGSYKKYYGTKFEEISNNFVKKISQEKERKSTDHIETVKFSLVKCFLQLGAKIVYKRPINKLGRKYIYDEKNAYFSMPNREEFIYEARKYTSSYMEMCSNGNCINVFDHLIWPQQISAVNDFFDENFKCIIVNRDPRDVFLLNKYYWHKPPVSVSKPHYPIDCKSFIEEWKRTVVLQSDNPKCLIINFEDLIYDYDTTINKIEKFLNLNKELHYRKNSIFEPDRSIENTQVFNVSAEWKQEIKLIEEQLHEYLYRFPVSRTPNKSLWFDTDMQLNLLKKGAKKQ